MELTFKATDLLNLCDQTIRKIDNYCGANPNAPEYLNTTILKLKTLKQALSYSVSTTTTMTHETYYSLFVAGQDLYYEVYGEAFNNYVPLGKLAQNPS